MLLTIFCIVLINFVGLTIVLPVFAPIILDIEYGFLPEMTDLNSRLLIYTLLMACYPIGQFFLSPVLGILSDHYGRKKILEVGLLASCFSFFMIGIGVYFKNLPILIFGRLMAGSSAGTLAICYSAISDIASQKNNVKSFSIVTLAIGIGWILGPLISGHISSLQLPLADNYALPFFLTAFLAFMNTVWVFICFQETLKQSKKFSITLLTSVKNVFHAVSMPKLNTIFLVWFLFMFGWATFMQFFSAFMMQSFEYTKAELGSAYICYGVTYAFSQLVITPFLAKWFSEEKIMTAGLLSLAVVICLVIFAPNTYWVIILFCFMALCVAITIPNSISLLSKLACKEGKGEIMGINQSVQSLAWMLSPFVMIAFASSNLKAHMWISSFAILVSSFVFWYFFKKRDSKTLVRIN